MTRLRTVALALALCSPGLLAAQGEVRVGVPLEQLQATARTDSNDAAAHYNLAVGYMSKKRWRMADTSLRMATRLDPRFAAAHLALGYLPYFERPQLWNEIYESRLADEWKARLAEAQREERAAYLIDPLVDRRILGAARPRVGWIFNAGEIGEFFNLYFQGLNSLEDGKYLDAYQRFNRLDELRSLRWFEGSDPIWINWYRGNAAAQLGNWERATADMQIILNASLTEEKKDSSVRIPLRTNDYRYILALFRQRAGQLDGAVALYREALSTDVGLYMANVHLAEIYEGAQRWPEAVAQREAAAAANPDDPSLLLDWGVTLGKAGRFADAEVRLQEAIQAQPRDARTYFWLGIAQQQLGKTAAARATFETFIALAPSRYAPQIASARQRLAQLQ